MKKILLSILILVPFVAPAQNFVHLGRFQEANAQLPAPGKNRTVFMGDSITEIWEPSFFDNNTRIGRGISGEVTAQMVLRFRQDVIEIGATEVVILAGTNDIALNQGDYNPDYTFGNIVTMVELAIANGIRPVLCSLLPASGYRWRPEVTDAPEKISALNARLKAYAAEHGIWYLDYFSAMVAPDGRSLNPDYTYDGVHPNVTGFKVMEKVFLAD